MYVHIALIVTAVKLLFIKLYHSTDFEVHRNWLAVTHNLTTDKWYYDTTSEWTLDYPPFFAWFEFGLSYVAKLFDPQMLELTNLNYDSEMTVLFQRLTVIVLDVIFMYGVISCSSLIGAGRNLVFILMTANPGILMVDHIHFQYNGFLYGIMFFSISCMIKSKFLLAAFLFAVLLNFKHIFLYIAPVYIVYLFRAYCFTVASKDGVHTAWYSFSFKNLVKLAATVIAVFAVSFGPFMNHLPQIISRLFPFKRGLSHAYWAPNFWALYNFVDKVLVCILKKSGVHVTKVSGAMTGGLVQEYEHAVLPTIKPYMTFVVTVLAMLPALVKMWHLCADARYRGVNFIRCIVVCASCAFMFGWHVHEKAILMILIPLSFLSVLGPDDAWAFLFLSTVGYYSLFPLLYPKNLLPIKIFMMLTHVAIAFSNLPFLYYKNIRKMRLEFLQLPMLHVVESLYLYGLFSLCIYENVIHSVLGLDKTLPFLPLMATSVYCGLGVFYGWYKYYYYFITFNLSLPVERNVVNQESKKVK